MTSSLPRWLTVSDMVSSMAYAYTGCTALRYETIQPSYNIQTV